MFCGLPWRSANFQKALNEMNLRKTSCSNGSCDHERYSPCVVLLFLAMVLEKSGYVYSECLGLLVRLCSLENAGIISYYKHQPGGKIHLPKMLQYMSAYRFSPSSLPKNVYIGQGE